jgi:hypothetical protein
MVIHLTNFDQAASLINLAQARKQDVWVGGKKTYRYGSPATVFGTGTLGVNVEAKSNPGKLNQIWFKPGESVEIEVV